MISSGSKTIRIAFLGVDAFTLPLARAVIESSRFELAGVCELDDGFDPRAAEAFAALTRRARQLDVWEALLDEQFVDAVVVARGADEDRRTDQLRKLIQAAMPVLVSHPVADSMLVYYELDMIRRETGCVALPLLPNRHHPALEHLAEIVRQGTESPIGKVEQVIVQRSIADPNKPNVVAQFARDVDLIRGIVGDMTRLGAMASAQDDSAYGSLGVQMSGPAGAVARWSVDPTQSAQGGHVSLLGPGGKAAVLLRPEGQSWTMELTAGGPTQTQQFDAWNSATAALDELARAIEGQRVEPDWVDAARSIELAETIDRSLQKGRTIELYYEDYTEQGTFKGTMTSLGCGLLLLGMIALGVVAIAEQMGLPWLRGWPYALLGAFGVFLLMQLLMLVFHKPESASDSAIPAADETRFSS
ncbi:MAG TPA: Gfo/Idh/MocA family oxidoreductase [Pirellulales bacterium]|jgi:predicted dehydrogenase|nr:Gfo/Idh/MocA family oxidoreductase [Pirellulales bacterium]